MKANCWISPNKVEVQEVPDPAILNSRDAIVKITSTAICGSDLHLYDGYIPTMEKGDILGHEFMGEIVEVGRGVSNLRVGDDNFALFLVVRDCDQSAKLGDDSQPLGFTRLENFLYTREALGDIVAGGNAAHLERTHCKLRARLPDGLRRDNPDRLANPDDAPGRHVCAIAFRA